jgi:thymidylate synthase
LKDLDASIWDEWGDEHGTIGMAYEYQIAKPVNIFLDPVHKAPESFRHYNSQTEYVLEYLRENPNGRWGVVTLWNPAELSGMNLVPCCHTSTWNLDGGRLNCVLDQRSGDMPYGVPFNTTQYAELMILLARDLGVKPGILTHVIADAHIYDRQMEGVDIQIKNYTLVEELRKKEFSRARQIAEEIYTDSQHSAFVKPWNSPETVLEAAKNALASRPEFACITEDTPAPFFEVSADDWKIKNYAHMGRVDFGDVVV